MDWHRHLFELTPLGKADKEVQRYLEHKLEPHQIEVYKNSLRHYRHVKGIQASLKVLLYASLITSFAATVGFKGQIRILEQIASYIGTTVIFILYSITSYIAMIRREAYHVQREILISRAAVEDNVEDLNLD